MFHLQVHGNPMKVMFYLPVSNNSMKVIIISRERESAIEEKVLLISRVRVRWESGSQ